MGRICTICNRQDRTEIEKCLLAGESYRAIAGRYRAGRGALQRHREHLSRTLVHAAARDTEHREDRLYEVSISQREARLARQNSDFELLEQIRKERGEDMVKIPGGSTGLLVRRVKKIGSGKDAEKVEEFAVDRDLLGARRKVEESAGRETGQLGEHGAAGSSEHGATIYIIQPATLSGPAARILQLDVPGRMAPPQEEQRRLAAAKGQVVDVKALPLPPGSRDSKEK